MFTRYLNGNVCTTFRITRDMRVNSIEFWTTMNFILSKILLEYAVIATEDIWVKTETKISY